jgi:hypothetical protein
MGACVEGKDVSRLEFVDGLDLFQKPLNVLERRAALVFDGADLLVLFGIDALC